MSSRITNTKRAELARALIERGMKDAKDALLRDQQAFGMQVYERLYPENTREIMDSLPSEFFSRNNEIDAIAEDNSRVDIVLPRELPVSAEHRYGHIHLTSAESKAAEALRIRDRELYRQGKQLKDEILGVLAACTSWKQLFKAWPEVAQFAASFTDEAPTSNLPAVIPQQLNSALRLP